MSVQFTIPGRPTSWQRHIEFVDKRTMRIVKKTPGDMKAAQDAIRWQCRAAMRSDPPMAGPVRLEVLAVYAVPPSWPRWKQEAATAAAMWKVSVPDHDNLVKQISDALNGTAYADDAQIVQTSMGKRYGHPERTEVRITEVAGLSDHSAKAECLNATEAARGETLLVAAPHVPCNTLTEPRR